MYESGSINFILSLGVHSTDNTVKFRVTSAMLSTSVFWKREIPVPWNELCDVVELGLWSMLSTADSVNSPELRFKGHTALIEL